MKKLLVTFVLLGTTTTGFCAHKFKTDPVQQKPAHTAGIQLNMSKNKMHQKQKIKKQQEDLPKKRLVLNALIQKQQLAADHPARKVVITDKLQSIERWIQELITTTGLEDAFDDIKL